MHLQRAVIIQGDSIENKILYPISKIHIYFKDEAKLQLWGWVNKKINLI